MKLQLILAATVSIMRVVILNQMVDQLCDSRLEDLAERPMLLDCCPLQIDATVTGNLLAGLDRLGTTRVMKTRGCGPACTLASSTR